MIVRRATSEDATIIHDLAHLIWPQAYKTILSAEQIAFMLEDIYPIPKLENQLKKGITFLIVEDGQTPVAFASYSMIDPEQFIYKLHKLYVDVEHQGRGIGALLCNTVRDTVKLEGGRVLELNVNRANPAFDFYKKFGFSVVTEVDIPYYSFVLNDYVMQLQL
jgi:diamine N-acetyltransferase